MAKKNMSERIEVPLDMIGRLQPQAIDFEESVLGALMLDNEAFDKIDLKPEYFYKESHQKIFEAITVLNAKHEPIDLLTVSNKLRDSGRLEEVGGPYYISNLTTKIASSSNIDFHAAIIHEKYIRRELIRMSSELIEQSYDEAEDTQDVINNYNSKLDAINNNITDSESNKSWVEIVKESFNELKKRIELHGQNKITGIQTPLIKLTEWTCGWQPQNFIVIAARPSMGKTAFALSCLKTAIKDGKIPIFFSLEMSDISLMNRLIIGVSGVDADDFRSGNLSDLDLKQIDRAIKEILEYKAFIDDRPKPINKIISKIRRLHKAGQCDIAFVDYLQLCTDDSEKGKIREQEVSTISRKLKLLAKELKIAVIALSQLNRSVESRSGDKRPQLSDLRESGAIEQDADMVMFLYRAEKYGIIEDDQGNSLIGVGEVIISKQREGHIGGVLFRYNESLTDIYDYDLQYDKNEFSNGTDAFNDQRAGRPF